MNKRVVAFVAIVGVLASGPACAKKNEDKLHLQRLLETSAHEEGVYRYSDTTPRSVFAPGALAQVRGLIEDDFRYKARLTVDGQDALDEVVNDDALAVRFLDPSYVDDFTSKSGGDAQTRAALAARYWVTDLTGAPSIGDAAVVDRTIGVDPIVDSLSVIDYANNAVAASKFVFKWNAERLDYRPKEDPFPRPAKGSGVTRWDLEPPDFPRADSLQSSTGSNNLPRAEHFRKMAIYVKQGRVVQIREQLAAKYDLLNRFKNYMLQFTEKAGKKQAAFIRDQLKQIEDKPDLLEAALNFALNQILKTSGEDALRFHTMVYEFTPATNVHADLPFGPDVKAGALSFFGVNAKVQNGASTKSVVSDTNAGTATTVEGESTSTTTSP